MLKYQHIEADRILKLQASWVESIITWKCYELNY
jgi:hypothetical protein